MRTDLEQTAFLQPLNRGSRVAFQQETRAMTYEQALLMARIRDRSKRELERGNIGAYMRLDRLSFEVASIRYGEEVRHRG